MRASKVLRGLVAVLAPVFLGNMLFGQLAAAQDSSSSSAPITFVIGTTSGLPTVNEFAGLTGNTYYVLSLNYDLLVNFDQKTLQASPGLATSWSPSSDGMTWTFKIRDGVTWQDGTPLTADDIVWTFKYVVQNHVGAFSNYFPFTTPDSFTAPDPHTFVWKATRPTTAPILPPWVYILPQHIWDQFKTYTDAKDYENFSTDQPTVGSGPFQLTQWDRGASWTLTANKSYWGGAPQIDQIIVRKYNNTEAMVNALKSGEVDYVGALTPDLFRSLQGAAGVTTHVGPATGFAQMSMNMCDPSSPDAPDYCVKHGTTGNPALLNPDVRLAIAHAIDKNALVERILQGYGEPGTTVVPPFAAFWHTNPTGDSQSYNPELAKQMLDAAGYKDTNGDGIREDPNGNPLVFRFLLRSEDDNQQAAGELIAGWLKAVGIGTKVSVVTTDKLTDVWYQDDFDLYIWSWGPDPDPDFILSTYTSGQCGVWSDTCYFNPAYDKLYTQQQTATSPDARKTIITQMQQIVYDAAPEIVLWYDNDLEAYRSDKWTGFVNSPEPQGFLMGQYTPYSELTVHPVAGAVASKSDTGFSGGIWIAVGAGIVLIVAVVALLRRRRPDEERA